MLDYPIEPPIAVKDSPRPRVLRSITEALRFIDDMFAVGRPPPWREMYDRLGNVKTEDEAVEAIGALRELLALEDLLTAP
jgi:hypothetical protein